jgi:thiosulfate/3-mercaptopyruvate sulfurtransferase
MKAYLHPETLVSTEWVSEHKNDNNVVIAEVDVDTAAYETGHIEGAVDWNWKTQLCDRLQRDIISKPDLEKLMSSSGIKNDTTIILYGDNNNWFAAWAFWQLKIYGHADVRIMNGGRKKWVEEGRELTAELPKIKSSSYKIPAINNELRSFLPEVQSSLEMHDTVLVDVRSPDEFSGKVLSPPGLAETCQRGGHIPGAKSIPWAMACNDDGTFRSAEELEKIYASKDVTSGKNIITYCRIGERSSHSWFVLKYLLGFPNVKNYDGSWTEWGNLVGAGIELGN